ncbi:hypothetical protein [Staphylococcus phage vB_SsapH-Golestan-105-M]|nr:hypothetical protein [Staphylococcus phage vB_SsapH-Golestan-105-M]
MIDILVVHYEETVSRVLKETIETIKQRLVDEHGLVKMTVTELTKENIESKFNDYNIVIAKFDENSHHNVHIVEENAKLIIDIPVSYLDIYEGISWDIDIPVDMLSRNTDFLDTMDELNEDLML